MAACKNISARRYPYFSQRRARQVQSDYTGVTALTSWGKLVAVRGTDLLYDGQVVGTVTALHSSSTSASSGVHLNFFKNRFISGPPCLADPCGGARPRNNTICEERAHIRSISFLLYHTRKNRFRQWVFAHFCRIRLYYLHKILTSVRNSMVFLSKPPVSDGFWTKKRNVRAGRTFQNSGGFSYNSGVYQIKVPAD